MTSLAHRLDRTISINAARETVFRFFTDPIRWAAWWGAGSTIDPQPGGRILIRYPDGTEATGEVIEMRPPEKISFSYGFVKGTPIPQGGSSVSIVLEDRAGATDLHLSHEFADATLGEEFVQGWRYQLSLFSNIVANEVNAGAAAIIDAWFEMWREPDAAIREQTITRIAAPSLRFRDRFSATDGIADLLPHIAASQRFMPGIRMERRGDVRHCQGTALVEWAALTGDRQERGTGTNVFVFDRHGRIESVTGFWRG